MAKITIFALHLGYGGIEKCISSFVNNMCIDNDIEIISTYKITDTPAFTMNEKVKIKYLLNDLKPNKKEIIDSIKKVKPIVFIKESFKSIKVLYYRKKLMIEEIKKCDSDYGITTRKLHNNWLGKYGNNIKCKIGWEHNNKPNDIKYTKEVAKSVKKLDYFVVVSKYLENVYSNLVKDCRVIYIPNSIDDIPNEISNLKNNSLIAIGRLSKEKGFSDLIDIFKQLNDINPNYTLDIVGDGLEYDNLFNKIKEYKLEDKIILHGYQNKEYINKLLLESSIYLMTSYEESFSLVVLEAFSYGVPVIAFDSSLGPRELITKKTGYLIKDRNYKEMVNKIIDLTNNKELIKEMGKNAHLESYKYSKEIIKKQWDRIIKQVYNMKKRVLFISSTGGHLDELMQLKPIFDDYNYYLITEKTKSNLSLKNKFPGKISFLVYGTKDKRFIYFFKFFYNCFKSLYFYIKIRPKYIVTTGTHTAVPICYIGKIFGSKIIFIETFANRNTKTLAGRLVYPLANLFIVQWEEMLKLYPKAIYGGWIY